MSKPKIFASANGVVLVLLAVWLLTPAIGDTSAVRLPVATGTAVPAMPSAAPAPTKADVLARTGKWFGISLPKAPAPEADLNRVSQAAGARPTMFQYFVKWDQDFNPAMIDATYRHGQLPIISWEPWAGKKSGEDQPKYGLSAIIDGEHDAYLTRFATAVRDKGVPLGIRFAHEMNGEWYPWSEKRSGNQPGQYAQAWRHIHDVFTKVGAGNVIWIWSPNILRPVPDVSLAPLYPGDAYVDWVGFVGYGAATEADAASTFDPTLRTIRGFTAKPVIITETGTVPGGHRTAWISDFHRWIAAHPDVVGFIWFEFSREQGGSADWRFSAEPETAQAFRAGLATLTLTPAVRVG